MSMSGIVGSGADMTNNIEEWQLWAADTINSVWWKVLMKKREPPDLMTVAAIIAARTPPPMNENTYIGAIKPPATAALD